VAAGRESIRTSISNELSFVSKFVLDVVVDHVHCSLAFSSRIPLKIAWPVSGERTEEKKIYTPCMFALHQTSREKVSVCSHRRQLRVLYLLTTLF
jgi:hypothetical protein